jgi:hypothetical protein
MTEIQIGKELSKKPNIGGFDISSICIGGEGMIRNFKEQKAGQGRFIQKGVQEDGSVLGIIELFDVNGGLSENLLLPPSDKLGRPIRYIEDDVRIYGYVRGALWRAMHPEAPSNEQVNLLK